jgi:hypothetical protein
VWLDVAQLEVVDSVEDHTGLATADRRPQPGLSIIATRP